MAVVYLEAVNAELVERFSKELPFLSSLQRVVSWAPGSKARMYPALDILLQCPLSVKRKKKQRNDSAFDGPLSWSELSLSASDLLTHEYPQPKTAKETKEPKEPKEPKDSTDSTDSKDSTDSTDSTQVNDDEWWTLSPAETFAAEKPPRVAPGDIVVVDCEMCITSAGFELTRLSAMAEDGTVLIDTFVLPKRPIIDYNTRYSGITAETLENCATDLAEAQRQLRALIPAEVYLVGHSLENDLRALKLIHERIIDTAVLYPHANGGEYKNSLRFLAQKYLQRVIQTDSHDSVEDCQACLDLVLLKRKRGLSFGCLSHDTESLWQRLERSQRKSAAVALPVTLQSLRATVGEVAALPVASDLEAVSKSQGVLKTTPPSFVVVQLNAMGSLWERETPKTVDKFIPESLRSLDSHAKQIFESLPSNALLIVLAGQGPMDQLTSCDAEHIEEKAQQLRRGMTFFGIR